MRFKELIEKIHHNAIDKGFWEDVNDRRRPLMLIISELGEAVEAHRRGKRANKDECIRDLTTLGFSESFKKNVKDTLEDELADTVIRLLDYSGKYAVKADKISSAYDEKISKGDYEAAAEASKSTHDKVNSNHIDREYKREVKNHEAKIKCIPSYLFTITHMICQIYHRAFPGQYIGEAIGKIQILCLQNNIDLEWHIQMKMKYNSGRPMLHGKNY